MTNVCSNVDRAAALAKRVWVTGICSRDDISHPAGDVEREPLATAVIDLLRVSTCIKYGSHAEQFPCLDTLPARSFEAASPVSVQIPGGFRDLSPTVGQRSGRDQRHVRFKPAAPHAERYWASLIALDGSQSVIEEHFVDEDLMDLADVLGFVIGNDALETTFRLEDLAEMFLLPLRVELEREGVMIDKS